MIVCEVLIRDVNQNVILSILHQRISAIVEVPDVVTLE